MEEKANIMQNDIKWIKKEREKHMRKIVYKILAVILITNLVIGIFPMTEGKAADIKLSETKKTVYTGDTFELKLNNAKGTLKWKSSNKKVATVTNGKVTALQSGKATISVTNKGATYKCKLTVKAQHLNCKSAELYVDGTVQLKLFGSNVTRWSSSDGSVASVGNNGLVTALKAGKTTVKALGANGKVYKCEINVYEMNDGAVPVSSLDYFAISLRQIYFDGTGQNSKVNYAKDNVGESHENVFTAWNDSYGERYVAYKLNGDYSYLSGVLYLTYDQRQEDAYYGNYIRIYGDGKELWYGKTERGDEPVPFQISIAGIDQLKIEVGHSWGVYCAIGEFELIP